MKTKPPIIFMAINCMVANVAAQQVPNGNFENWYTPAGASYQDPADWITLNAETSVVPGMGLACTQGSPGMEGSSYYMTATTRAGAGLGTVPSVVVAGNTTTHKPGFPFAYKPDDLIGFMMYGGTNDSSGITITLTKWNASGGFHGIVGMGTVTSGAFPGMAMDWVGFQIPITYYNLQTPDSAFIVISSNLNPPTVGNFISVENLAFTYPTGVAEHDAAAIQVYPSPATDLLHVGTDRAMARVTLLDITGRTVLVQPETGNMAQVDVADLKQGRYLVQVEMQDGKRIVRSFVKE
ncbi:MAG: T9SS type A sorting domain-containing protein [Bacteroidetes bacterium]|nr:T9SS type A sorting domain-containing protein [Bacteroidota bacterium]